MKPLSIVKDIVRQECFHVKLQDPIARVLQQSAALPLGLIDAEGHLTSLVILADITVAGEAERVVE